MSAPVLYEAIVVEGYEDNSDAPKLYQPSIQVVQAEEVPNVQPLTASSPEGEACRAALVKYIDKTCCWGSAPAKKCNIEKTTPFVSCVTTLRSFAETRNTNRKTAPYRGGNFTMCGQGRAPQPWEMPFGNATLWHDCVEYQEVPYTSQIVRCSTCSGDGRVDCSNCHRSGKVQCTQCGGCGSKTFEREGQQVTESCQSCGGDGKCNCSRCSGTGQITCSTCQGAGQLRHYIELARQHRTLKHFQVVDDIPDADLEPAKIEAAPGTPLLDFSAGSIVPPAGYSADVDKALLNINTSTLNEKNSLGAYVHQVRIIYIYNNCIIAIITVTVISNAWKSS